jgi:hypothetical protein
MTDETDYFSIADNPRSDLIRHCERYGDLTPTTRKWLIGHTKPFFLEADCLHGLLDDLEPIGIFFHLTY